MRLYPVDECDLGLGDGVKPYFLLGVGPIVLDHVHADVSAVHGLGAYGLQGFSAQGYHLIVRAAL